jgi:hypothetical protein
MAQLPLGSYTIAVQAADNGGDTADNTDAGTLAFIVYPTVTLSVSPSTFSYGQTVTFSGTDIGLYPDGSTAPVAGEIIANDEGSAVTNGAGQFSFTVQAGIGNGKYLGSLAEVYAAGNATMAAAQSKVVKTSVAPLPVRFTGVTVAPSPVTWPNGPSIVGTASYESGSTWLPLADVSSEYVLLSIYGGGPHYFYQPVFTLGTDSSGTFTASVPGPMNTTSIELTMVPGPDKVQWFTSTPVTVELPVIHAATLFESFNRVPRSRGRIRLRSCVDVDTAWNMNILSDGPIIFVDPAELRPFPEAKFQYAATKHGPWRTVRGAARVKATRTTSDYYIRDCYQSSTVKRPLHANWYRFFMPPTTAWLGTKSPAARR